MPIAVFDIDGTLTDTMDVDVECYEGAIREILGIEVPATWPSMDEVTDSAILETTCQEHGHPLPDGGTLRRIADRVSELLTIQLRERPERFTPIPGAREIFAGLRGMGWRVAMATGAWRPSTVVKLAGARIPTDGVPLATSTEYRARRDIIRHAVSAFSEQDTDVVVYVGDGVWDGRAATSLGYGFVGLGPTENEAALRGVGASGYVHDLSDAARLVSQLELAGHEF